MAWKAFIFPLAVSHRRCFRVETDAFFVAVLLQNQHFCGPNFCRRMHTHPQGGPTTPQPCDRISCHPQQQAFFSSPTVPSSNSE